MTENFRFYPQSWRILLYALVSNDYQSVLKFFYEILENKSKLEFVFQSRDHKERRLPIPVEIPRVPELPSNGPVKKSFHPRLVIERKAELNQSIRRTASDIAITDKL